MKKVGVKNLTITIWVVLTTLIFSAIGLTIATIVNFNLKKSTNLDGIRIMFKKEQLPIIFDFCKKLKELNYEISLNPVSITNFHSSFAETGIV
jgi:hypothetical protein